MNLDFLKNYSGYVVAVLLFVFGAFISSSVGAEAGAPFFEMSFAAFGLFAGYRWFDSRKS